MNQNEWPKAKSDALYTLYKAAIKGRKAGSNRKDWNKARALHPAAAALLDLSNAELSKKAYYRERIWEGLCAEHTCKNKATQGIYCPEHAHRNVERVMASQAKRK